MKTIRRCAFVGMGALGLMFGKKIRDELGEGSVTFLMDEKRLQRHSTDRYTINGETVLFPMEDIAKSAPFDLVVVAVKYGALAETIEQIAPAVGEDTILISVMNGITSEDMLAKRYARKQIIDCVAIGMDAMRDGTDLSYTKMGRLQIGSSYPEQQENVESLAAFFESIGFPYEKHENIRWAMWNKFMLNVGINQACTAYETDYAHATRTPLVEEMSRAMQEVADIAAKRGIELTEKDIERCIEIERTLKPDGYPSMRQDAVAKRPTELDMFAGEVIRQGREVGVATPVNEKYAEMIRKVESRYL